MAWWAIYNGSTGRLVSTGEADVMPVIAGMVALELAGRPNFQSQMWDETNRIFVVRPPKVLIDRLDDIQNNPNYQDFMDAFQSLSAANRTKLRNAVIRLIARHRWRSATESTEIP